ncbi:MAG: hypothetical protein IH978_03255 [Nitrospinae bacterium]|nr:hypothetical protein [Nitrospinota bacterium]
MRPPVSTTCWHCSGEAQTAASSDVALAESSSLDKDEELDLTYLGLTHPASPESRITYSHLLALSIF